MRAIKALAFVSLFVAAPVRGAGFSLFGADPPALLARPLELPASPLRSPAHAPVLAGSMTPAGKQPSTGKIVALAGAYQAAVFGAGYLLWWK